MESLTNSQKAVEIAIEAVIEKLSKIDLIKQCRLLDLPFPDTNGKIKLKAFGKELIFQTSNYNVLINNSEIEIHPVERLLILRYLIGTEKIEPSGELISFRDFPGGKFYWEPFKNRTVVPLINKIGNNINFLQTHIDRYDWDPLDIGDFGASIHVVGNIFIHVVYRLGDEEFSPSADILFDSSIKKVYSTEDVIALSSRICFGLMSS